MVTKFLAIGLLGSALVALSDAAATKANQKAATTPSPTVDALLAVTSPAWLASITPITGLPTEVPSGTVPTGALATSIPGFNVSAYPTGWKTPPIDSDEVKAVISAIDWTKVPAAPTRTGKSNGDLVMTGYNENTDPYCWWSDTNCVKPKVDYLPEDIYYCPRPGDWGLTYDDGPFNPSDFSKLSDSPWAEPNLYNFLAAHNQKATLFYIGSNVVGFPAAAQRAIQDGLTICVHTWSHPQMTTKSNDEVVAEFYWTLRSIKESTGITPRCWRPPYGDVDDRVRAIAWQMGMRTIIWDEDTNDWNMPGDGGGNLSPNTVDGYFQGWIDAYKNGTDKTNGHIVLEHELNNATVSMAEKWLPTLQTTFNVVPVHECMNISNPYWEDNFVYATENGTASSSSASADPTTTDMSSALSTAPPASTETSNEDGALSASASAESQPTSGSSVMTVSSLSALMTAFFAVCLL
ncbi:hypothetical protein K450DRAFT_246862 [Umbelopsis ramanniana AG]|uniref:NodB homology domain-containing protein n=1 Tax=Umbelopsis ramanniana AG TaxID=1314678 RepID=A0AAD5E835_UMBRA|nr:uncharacterized protein K450DRAFT_246862 [Umbelopsis ramanniana AG]KAI8578449.1 hypothetical protein K450DRAFT_246862 [Umbelopsis ramanniana AG]